MAENKNPSESEKRGQGGKVDAELEQLLIQVFGSKDNLEKERQKAAQQNQRKPSVPDVSFADQRKDVNKTAAENNQHRPQGNKRPANSQSQVKRKPPQQKRPVQNSQGKPKPKGGNPPPKGKKPTNGQRPVDKNKTQDQRKRSAQNPTGKKQTGQAKKRKKLTGGKKVAAIIGTIAGVLLVLGLLIYGLYSFYYSLFGKYSGERNEGEYQYDSSDFVDEADTLTEDELRKKLEVTADDPMKDKDVFNVLLIGEDLRDSETQERGNTDVMMMISLNKKLKTITMTSFLRDTWVDIEGYGTAKLNAAYWRDGPELLKDTIEKYYGVSIDRYVIVNFESFMTIVDTIGGITLDVRDDEAEGMKEPMAEQNDILGNKRGTDYLQSGGTALKLNGNQALAFARLRYVGNADYERTERQRRVITEIINESKKLSLIEINDLVQEIFPEIKLDITKSEMASLLLNCLDYMNYEIQELRIPSDNTFTEEIISNLSVLCPDFQANKELLISTIYGESAVSSENSTDNYYDDYTDYNDYNDYNNY